MRPLLLAFIAALTLACGGGSSSSSTTPTGTGGNGGPSNTPTTQPFPKATLRPKTTPTVAEAATVGTLQPVMIVSADGIFRFETSDFQHALGALYVDSTGALKLTGDSFLIHPDGTTAPFTLTGQQTGDTITGTSSAGPFSLSITALQQTAVDLAAQAGDYLSTASSDGFSMSLHLNIDGTFTGYCFNNPADIGHPSLAPATFSGHMNLRTGDVNVFDCGLQLLYSGEFSPRPATWGFAFFDGTTLTMTTANQNDVRGGQFSVVWTKQP